VLIYVPFGPFLPALMSLNFLIFVNIRVAALLLLYASSCCSKRLSEIRPRLGTKTRPAALVSQAALAGNGVFNLSWLQRWPNIQRRQWDGGIM